MQQEKKKQLVWVEGDVRVVILFLGTTGSCWSLYYLSPPLCIDQDSLHKRSYWTPALCVSLEAHFFALEKKTVLSKFKRYSFLRARKKNKNAKDCDVNMHTDRLLELFREKLSAPSVHGGARCVSGPALVRTAPALPTPWNPNFHAPSSCPSLTTDPANHDASAASTSAPSPDIIGRGIPPIGWRETRGPMTPPHVLCVDQCGGSAKRHRARGVDDHMFNFN